MPLSYNKKIFQTRKMQQCCSVKRNSQLFFVILGVKYCMNSGGPEVTKEVLEHVSALSNDVKDMSFEHKEQMNKVFGALNDIQNLTEKRFQDFEQRVTKLEEEGLNKGTYISLGVQRM